VSYADGPGAPLTPELAARGWNSVRRGRRLVRRYRHYPSRFQEGEWAWGFWCYGCGGSWGYPSYSWRSVFDIALHHLCRR
jgi:hypothetical protein